MSFSRNRNKVLKDVFVDKIKIFLAISKAYATLIVFYYLKPFAKSTFTPR